MITLLCNLLLLILCSAEFQEKEERECNAQCKLIEDEAEMGYVIKGIQFQDITNLDTQSVNQLKSTLLKNGVVVIERQNMTKQQLIDFSAKLGQVVVLPPSLQGNDPDADFPAIKRVTNYWSNGTWKENNYCFGCHWHKDGDFQQNGYMASVLYADELTENRSATLFLDNCEVVQKLTDKTRKDLSESVFEVSFRHITDYAKGKKEDPQAKRHMGIYHHPENGRKCAYMTANLVTEKGVAHHLAGAWVEVTEKSKKYTHFWKKGDVVIWDNLAVMHKAGTTGFVGPGDRTPRMLYRTQVLI